MKEYIKLLRIKHWVKNGLIFLPLFFGLKIFDMALIGTALQGALAFCLMASSIYIINDIFDYEKDRVHPYKCKRPIASGKVSKANAAIEAVCIIAFSILLLYMVPINEKWKLYLIYGLYFLANVLYSVFHWKNVPIIDVCILSSGFILRVFFGSVLTGIEISSWLYLVIIFGALYLGLAKRRGELMDVNTTEKRKVLEFYTYEFLDKNMYMSLTITIVFYALWCYENTQYEGVLWSIPVLVLAIFRYNFLIEKKSSSGDPMEIIVKDIPLLALGLALAIYLFICIYGVGGI